MNYLDNDIDFFILKKLQLDGRISFTDLAKELNVSISTIRNRYTNLVNEEVISIYGRIDPEKVGLKAYSRILVSVRPKNKIYDVVKELTKIPEISFLASVSGDFDLEINILCRDNNHLMEILHFQINTIDGVYNSKTNFYLKIFKFSQPDLDHIKKYN